MMTKLIRSRAARIDTALFVAAAVLWAICPYVVHRVSSSEYLEVELVRMIAPDLASPAADLPIYFTHDQAAAAGRDLERHDL